MNLPNSFISAVQKHGIQKEDIVFAATEDLDMEYRFADSVVALTKCKLILALYPYQEKTEYHLGGYSGWQQRREETQVLLSPALLLYDLQKIEKLQMLRQISTAILMARIDGTDRNLCHFSNTRAASFGQLCKIFDKLTKQEELTPKDLDVSRGKESCPKCMNKKSILLRVMSYFKPYKWSLAVMMLCYLGTALLNLVWPYLSGTVLYDRVLAREDGFLRLLGLPAGRFTAALGILVLAMILTKVTIQGVLTARIAPEVVAKVKSQVFASMGRLSISFFTKRQTGGLMTRVSNDAEEISSFFIDGIPYFFINLGTLTATCVIMFVLNPLLALVSVIFMPLLLIISKRMLPHLWHYYGKRHRPIES